MKNLKKDLQVVARALKGISVAVEKIQKQVDKLDKPKAKAKVVKKVAAKKAPAKKVTAKKAAAKKPATAVDTVLGIINRYKKGVDTSALMKKTGFSQRKIHNIVYKLKKQGKVKSVGKGVYLKG